MKSVAAYFALLALTAGCAAHAAPPPAADAGRLTIDKLIDIRHPSNPLWAPDGKHVVFVWDRAGVSKVYVADAASGSAASAEPRELAAAGSSLGGAFWSTDGKALMTAKEGDLWRVPIDGSAATAVWTTPQIESNIVPSPDGTKVAFVRGSSESAAGAGGGRGRGGAAGHELWVRSLADHHETLVARGGDDKAIGGIGWSPDGTHLVFTEGAHTIRHEQTPAYSGSKIIFTVNENVPGDTMVVAASGGSPKALGAGGGFGGRRWLDARHFIIERTSPDFKRRTMTLVDINGGEPKTLHEDVEEKFWSMTGDAGGNAQPSPDGKWIAFLSDRDGWDHLYVTAGGRRRADSNHEGRLRVVAADVVAGQHADRVRRERAGSLWRPPPLCRDDRQRSGACDDRRADERTRDRYRAELVARWHPARLSAHRRAQLRRPVDDGGRDRMPRRRGCRTRCRRRSTSRRSSNRRW